MSQPNGDVKSLDDLLKLEQRIADEVRKYPLDALLLGLRSLSPLDPVTGAGVPLHVLGVAARFAIRFGKPGPITTRAGRLHRTSIDPILRLVSEFAHADPSAWLGKPSDSLVPLLLRLTGNQFNYKIGPSGKWARAEIMFNELPEIVRGKNGVSDFDFHSHFKSLTGVTVREFIDIGFLAWCAAASGDHLGFSRDWFETARKAHFSLPDDATIQKVLSRYAADSATHAAKSIATEQKDRNYAPYDFNSLFVYPLIRPWPLAEGEEMDLDRMLAPIPNLLLYRMTTGIFLDMQHKHKKDFNPFFGHLLSAYVGRVLSGFVKSPNLISEEMLRQTYPDSSGKAPDWIIIDEKTAILIEVKSAPVPRKAYATGDMVKFDEVLNDIRAGLTQLFEFRNALLARKSGLERFARCKECICIVVTMESFFISNSVLLKDHVRSTMTPQGRASDWAMLCLDDLEWFQVHLSDQQVDIASAFRLSLNSSSEVVVNSMAKQSGRQFRDSMFYETEVALYKRLGVNVNRNIV